MTKKSEALYRIFAFVLIIAAWWVLSLTMFRQTGIIPTPPETVQIIREEMQKDSFFPAIFSTLQRSITSFIVSFLAGGVLAALSHFAKFIGIMLSPFIALCRAMPTMALVLILLLAVGSDLLPIVVAFLIVFPLCYENIKAAIAATDKKLITMAKVFKIPKLQQATGIYIPAMLPFVFSSVIAGFGLNIKVVISAEVMGLPAMSIGHLMLSARQGFNFGVSFAWLVIAVILALICEFILKRISRLCMPYKYSDLKTLKNAFNRMFAQKSNTARR
ncbi:MAG: ABC transporter permease subunit [Oscillospiraceae bacterium]|nr:ABC transporter permease subunit [Oscillospiraceae bacterium]MCL2279064.1 ABC transporter permease subunit [Oscillospiraceae bacterium]